MMNYFKKNFLNKEIILTVLISLSLWLSIGTKLQINQETLTEKKVLLENFRYILPLVILLLITIFRNNNPNLKNLKFIILIIFFSYIIGYINFYFINNNYIFNFTLEKILIENGYIPNKIKDIFFCFFFITTFFILVKLSNEEIKIINIINYFIILLISFITLYYSYEEYIKNSDYYLYYTNFLVKGEIFGVSSPRSLGLARNLLIISFPLTIFCFFFKKKKLIKYSAYLILIIIVAHLIQTQSRTSNYFFYLFIFLIFLIKIKHKQYKDLIIIFFIALILPIILSNSIPKLKIYLKNYNYQDSPKIFEREASRLFTLNPNKIILDKQDKNVSNEILNTYSSGRIQLWKKAINIFLNEEKFKFKNLGFGPLSDRYFIKENISNAILYSLFAGGVLGLIGILILYAITIKEIIKFISFKKNITKDLMGSSSILILIYLIFRSFFETSFVLFGTDHILFISNLIFIKIKNNKII